MSKDDQRRRLAFQVLHEAVPIAEAARQAGVSRPTAHAWVARAKAEGIAALAERSRRPVSLPTATETAAPQIVDRVLACRKKHPKWGARKLHRLLWPEPETAPISARTVGRLLQRHGLVAAAPSPSAAATGLQRFERETCNELWQMDYKGRGRRPATTLPPWEYPLSLLDDHSRFCLALLPVPVKTGEAAYRVLWEILGEFGLPECILCDNGDDFNNTRSFGPTWLQARLWLLGIRTTHGRPYHPQTQGKVERFHGTLETEVGGPYLGDAARLAGFRESYNWERPHEALDLRVPGAVYTASTRRRPERLPEHEIAEGATVRKVDSAGKIYYRNQVYRPGRGLGGEWVVISEEESGEVVSYAGVRFAALTDLQVR